MEDVEQRTQASKTAPNHTGRGWSVSNQLKAASILATLVVSILSLVLSTKTRGDVSTVSATRVEIGTRLSNSNAGDFARPWTAWEEPITPTTLYVGVKRRIQFKRPFAAPPRVSTAFGLIDVYPIEGRLLALGFVLPDDAPGRDPIPTTYVASKATVGARLKDFHVVSFAAAPDDEGFTLMVGIGLPTAAGEFLVSQLQTREPPAGILEGMRRYGQLSGESGSLTPNERWLANFYTLVGSFDVTWTAQQ